MTGPVPFRPPGSGATGAAADLSAAPPAGRLAPSRWRLLGRRGLVPDLATATFELARARWRLRRHDSRELIALGRRQGHPERPVPLAAAGLVERVAFAVPRAAVRVPWRADCWVQALAAQAWLARHGVPTEIWIGVRKDRPAGFEAHAWLVHEGRNVTGGDTTGMTPLVTPDTDL